MSTTMNPRKQFFAIISENTDFFKHIAYCKNIQQLICDKKGYIQFGSNKPPFPKKWS